MKKCMVYMMMCVVITTAHGGDKAEKKDAPSRSEKDKRPKPIDLAVVNAQLKEKPKSPSDTTEVPKADSGERQAIFSHTTTKINWEAVKKQQDKA